MQVVPGVFTCGKVALKLFFLPNFFSNIVESVLFYSGMVTREVESGKREAGFSRWRNRKKLDSISYRFVHVTEKGLKRRGN